MGTVTGVVVSAGTLRGTSGKIPLFFQQFRFSIKIYNFRLQLVFKFVKMA